VRNQPKYHFFKNTNYALAGMKDLLQHETSFKIELFIVMLLLPVIFYIEISLTHKLLLFITLMGMLIAEAINSAIERVVDLVTLEHHPMAGRAKDVGSAVVFISIAVFVVTWLTVLTSIYL